MEESEKAKRRAMYLIGSRDYGEKELYDKLRKNYSEETAAEVTALMRELGYIDDRKYADKLARKYIEVKKYGKSRALAELRLKGIDSGIIEETLGKYSDEDLVSAAAEILRKKYTESIFDSGDEGKKELQKAVASLARRGFGWSDIKEALYIVRDELENEETEEE